MLKIIFQNLIKVIKSKLSITAWIISWWIILRISNDFTNYDLMLWNYGPILANIEYYSNFLIAFLFWLLIASTTYKIYFFGNFSKYQSWGWIIWSIASIVTIWCPACSITLASYIGIGGTILSMPYFWLEIKAVWILVLLISLFFILKDLEVCKITKK